MCLDIQWLSIALVNLINCVLCVIELHVMSCNMVVWSLGAISAGICSYAQHRVVLCYVVYTMLRLVNCCWCIIELHAMWCDADVLVACYLVLGLAHCIDK